MTRKIVDCIRDGKVIAEAPPNAGITIGPTVPDDPVKVAQQYLIDIGEVKPPFDFAGIKYGVRDI